MQTVPLPHSDLQITKAVFGTSRLGGTMQSGAGKDAIQLLRLAQEAGIRTFDTADIYAQGAAETLLAKAFSGMRDQVIYATKGGYVLSSKARLLSHIKPLLRPLLKRRASLAQAAGRARGSMMNRDFSPTYLRRAVEASLKRLRTDYIDLYQLHSPSPEHLRRDETFEALAALKQEGKIRAYGVSLLKAEDLHACTGRGLSWAQVPTGFLQTDPPDLLRDTAKRDGILLAARQVFGSGLMGKPPETWTLADFQDNPAELDAARLAYHALQQRGTPHEVLLRNLHHQSSYDCFLFATTSIAHLRANLHALQLPAVPTNHTSEMDRPRPHLEP